MRISRAALVLAISLVLAVAGCSKQIAGTAQPDPNQPPLALSEDGFGIVAGFEDAPTRIEIFTEPQCSHCAELQADFGDQLAYYIGIGALKVTYRPLTFLDDGSEGYSAHVSNAMFLVAEGDATGTQFQRFVQELYGHQERTKGGPGPATTKWPRWRRQRACRTRSPTELPAAGLRSTSQDMDDTQLRVPL